MKAKKKRSPEWMKEMRDRKKEYAKQRRGNYNARMRVISCPACGKEYEKSKDVVNYSFLCKRCGNEIHIDENGKISVFSVKIQMDSADSSKDDSQRDKKEIADRQGSGTKEKKENEGSQINTFDIKKWSLVGVLIICVGVLYGNR